MPSTIDRIRDRLPQFYNLDPNSNVMKILGAFVEEIDRADANNIRIASMTSISKTYGEDLYDRWGLLFGIKRQPGESDNSYRARLKLMVTSLSGGTIDSVRYSIAVGLGINNDTNAIDKLLKIYDGWEYAEPLVDETLRSPGNIICVVDLENQVFSAEKEQIVRDAINNVKAAGVNAFVTFNNYRIVFYAQLEDVNYSTLSNIAYNKIGG